MRTYVIDAALMTLPREPRTEPDIVLPAQRHLVQSTSVVASGGHTLQSEASENTSNCDVHVMYMLQQLL